MVTVTSVADLVTLSVTVTADLALDLLAPGIAGLWTVTSCLTSGLLGPSSACLSPSCPWIGQARTFCPYCGR